MKLGSGTSSCSSRYATYSVYVRHPAAVHSATWSQDQLSRCFRTFDDFEEHSPIPITRGCSLQKIFPLSYQIRLYRTEVEPVDAATAKAIRRPFFYPFHTMNGRGIRFLRRTMARHHRI